MAISNKLEKIEEKLENISGTQIRHQATLETLTASVVEHVKRTNALEETIKPIQGHVLVVGGVFKAVGVLATVVAAGFPIFEFLWRVFHKT